MSACDDLVSFADGELSVRAAARFRAHLSSCDGCRCGLVDAMALSARLADIDVRSANTATAAASGTAVIRHTGAAITDVRVMRDAALVAVLLAIAVAAELLFR